MSQFRARLGAGLLAFGLLVASGCTTRLKATRIDIVLTGGEIGVATVVDQHQILQGEVVLRFQNFETHKVRMVLARKKFKGERLPRNMIEAEIADDDQRIVAITPDLPKVKRLYTAAGIRLRPGRQNLHVHVRKGEQYVLFEQRSARNGKFVGLFRTGGERMGASYGRSAR